MNLEEWMICRHWIRFGVEAETRDLRFDYSYCDESKDQRSLLADAVGHHLCQIPRFAGAAPKKYNVAQHSALCRIMAGSMFVYHKKEWTDDDRMMLLHVLLHDAHEMILGDVPKPVLGMLGKAGRVAVKQFKDEVQEVILRELGVSSPSPDHARKVETVDKLALMVEKLWFFECSVYSHPRWSIEDDEDVIKHYDFVLEFARSSPPPPGVFWTLLGSDLHGLKKRFSV